MLFVFVFIFYSFLDRRRCPRRHHRHPQRAKTRERFGARPETEREPGGPEAKTDDSGGAIGRRDRQRRRNRCDGGPFRAAVGHGPDCARSEDGDSGPPKCVPLKDMMPHPEFWSESHAVLSHSPNRLGFCVGTPVKKNKKTLWFFLRAFAQDYAGGHLIKVDRPGGWIEDLEILEILQVASSCSCRSLQVPDPCRDSTSPWPLHRPTVETGLLLMIGNHTDCGAGGWILVRSRHWAW